MSKLSIRRRVSNKKRRRLFLYWFIALILVAAFFTNFAKGFLGAVSVFTSQTSGAKLTFEKFEGEKIIGVVISDPLLLVTFDPDLRLVDIFELPQNLYLTVGKSGFYRAAGVYYLSKNLSTEGSKSQGDAAQLAAALMSNFAIPIDFYLDFGGQTVTIDKIFEWREKIAEPASFLWFFQLPKSAKLVSTNLTLVDQYKLLWQLRAVRRDKFNIRSLTASNFEEVILPDGAKAVKVFQEGFRPEIANTFGDLKVVQEGLTVAVYNATRKTGLAQLIAQIATNFGAKAAVGGESDQPLSKTKIYVGEGLENSKTLKRLKKTFGGEVAQQTDSHLADIVIFAGEDLAQKFSF